MKKQQEYQKEDIEEMLHLYLEEESIQRILDDKSLPVLITIEGVYHLEGEEDDTIEVFTLGTFYREGDEYFITYEESDTTGYDGCITTLHVEGNQRVTLKRSGVTETYLVVQNGVRHQGIYDMGFGDMMIGIRGKDIRADLHDTGGELMFHYALDVNSVVTSENKLTITIKERD